MLRSCPLSIKFKSLRGQVHHSTYPSRYDEKSLEELEREVESAKRIIKQIIRKDEFKIFKTL